MNYREIPKLFANRISKIPKHFLISFSAVVVVVIIVAVFAMTAPQETPIDTEKSSDISETYHENSFPSESSKDEDETKMSDETSLPTKTPVSTPSEDTTIPSFESPTESSETSLELKLKEISEVFVNVKDFGARGDGKSDDSSAIKNAIESIRDTGGAVYLPAGMYKMSQGVLVPLGVAIIGEKPSTVSKWHEINVNSVPGANEAAGNSWISDSNFKGTWVMPTHGKGDVNSSPTFRLQGNTTVENIGFVYPDQAPVTSQVSEYPAAIAIITTPRIRFTRDGVRIANINILNAYVGIAIMQEQDFNNYYVGTSDTRDVISTGRMTVHNITGSPLWKGIYIKGILDTVDIDKVHFGLSNYNRTFAQYRHDNCVDIEVARADGINISNSFSLGASYGVKTTTAFTGSSSIRADSLVIKGRIPVSLVTGLYKFNNVDLTMVNYGNFSSSSTFRGVEVFQDNRCVHQPFYLFSNMTVTNSVKSTNVSNIGMHIKLGKRGNVSVNESEFNDANPTDSEPVILFEKNDASPISVMFNDTVFNNSASSGLLAEMVNINSGAMQFNNCAIEDNLYESLPSNHNIWFADSRLKSGATLNIN